MSEEGGGEGGREGGREGSRPVPVTTQMPCRDRRTGGGGGRAMSLRVVSPGVLGSLPTRCPRLAPPTHTNKLGQPIKGRASRHARTDVVAAQVAASKIVLPEVVAAKVAVGVGRAGLGATGYALHPRQHGAGGGSASGQRHQAEPWQAEPQAAQGRGPCGARAHIPVGPGQGGKRGGPGVGSREPRERGPAPSRSTNHPTRLQQRCLNSWIPRHAPCSLAKLGCTACRQEVHSAANTARREHREGRELDAYHA